MSTENFDDAIKRKLEGIEPLINNKDIDRVHQYVTMHRSSFPFLRSPRFFWAMMGTGMLATCLVTWKLTTVFDHTSARQATIAAAVKKTAETATTPAATRYTDAAIAQNNNTTTAATVNNNAAVVDAAGNAQTNAAHVGLQSSGANNINYFSTVKRGKNADHRIAATALSASNVHSEKTAKTAMLSGTSGNGNSSVIANQTVNGQQNNHSIAAETKSSTDNTVTTSSGAPNANAANNEQNAKPETVAPEKNAQTPLAMVPKKDSALITEKKKDTVALAAKKVPGHDYADAHKKATKNNAAFHVNYMAGAGYEYDKTQNGWGVFGKVLVNNRFGLNIGFKMMNINDQSYANDTGYDNTHAGSFRSKFAPGLNNDWGIYKIGISYSLMQIPISLEYNIPVSSTVSLSLAAGTDIDINCTEAIGFDEISYTFMAPQPNSAPILEVLIANQKINKTYAPAVFNNLVITPGITWQFYNHFALQASGFASPQLKEVYYKGPATCFFGGNLKLYYVF